MKITRYRLIAVLGIVTAFALAVPAAKLVQDIKFAKRAPLTVHEWGTFTSVQGSDGVGLEGLQHEEERLPRFVYSRTKVRECPLRNYGYKGLEVPVSKVTQKMETPVLYFYTATNQNVRVRVDFIHGLISQWYPVSNLLGPPEKAITEGPLDLSKITSSFLEWEAELTPWTGKAPADLPAVRKDDPWSFAREVSAASVRTLPHSGWNRRGPVESERFLFYRGLGSFSIPVTVAASPGGETLLNNSGKHELPQAFALEMGTNGGRFLALGAIAANRHVSFNLRSLPLRNAGDVVADLKGIVRTALVSQGLFEDEANAMVNTWSRQWFLSEGTRVIYFVPRDTTDALLPLHITPEPDRIVRQLVGRLEYLTPAVEAEITQALRERLAPDPIKRDAAMARLLRLDRFLEPHIRRAMAREADPLIQESCRQLLETLQKEARTATRPTRA